MDAVQELSGRELIDEAMASRSEAAKTAALERIDQKLFAIRKQIDKGVTPAEHKRLDSVRTALEVSRTVCMRAFEAAKPEE
ncbi:MAG: hypothetical protein AAF713_02680 [Pseudomonadota bacterium]